MSEGEAAVTVERTASLTPSEKIEEVTVSNDENAAPNVEPAAAAPVEEKAVAEVNKEEAPPAEQPPAPSNEEPSVTTEPSAIEVVSEDAVEEKAPEPSPEEIQRQLDSQTSFIESIESVSISLKEENHLQLQRPGVKLNARRGRTKQTKSFAELEEEERKREEEALKPKQDVDQAFDDPHGLLAAAKPAQRTMSIAQEAQNVHAAFMQKAKERKEKEEAERKAREAHAIKEEHENNRKSVGRPKSSKTKPSAEGEDGGKVEIKVAADGADAEGGDAAGELNFADKLKAKLQQQGCCVIS